MGQPIIEIQDVSKTFGAGGGAVHALEHVSLTVERGEIYGIIGLSGAGKSTLVRCMNLLERPTEGRVIVDGRELTALRKQELRQARAIVADRAQIVNDAKREAETIIRVAEERARNMVNQDEIVRQAQAKANDLITQAQAKFREMRRASNEYIDDLMKRTDDALAENLAELRKTRQNIKASQRGQ